MMFLRLILDTLKIVQCFGFRPCQKQLISLPSLSAVLSL